MYLSIDKKLLASSLPTHPPKLNSILTVKDDNKRSITVALFIRQKETEDVMTEALICFIS